MKKTIRSISLTFIFLTSLFTQTRAESTTDSLLNVLIKADTALANKVTKVLNVINNPTKPDAPNTSNTNAEPKKNDTPAQVQISSNLKWPEWLLIYFPIIFFFLILWFIYKKLKHDKIALKDFLIDKEILIENKEMAVKELEAKTQAVNAGALAPVPNVEEPINVAANTTASSSDKNQSVSRLIAFLCGFTSVAIAVCICTVYFYNNFTGHFNSSMDNLSSILYSLGLGVIPYGLNKISSVLKVDRRNQSL